MMKMVIVMADTTTSTLRIVIGGMIVRKSYIIFTVGSRFRRGGNGGHETVLRRTAGGSRAGSGRGMPYLECGFTV